MGGKNLELHLWAKIIKYKEILTSKLIDLIMFGVQFFANFETKLLLIFLKGIDNKIFHFT